MLERMLRADADYDGQFITGVLSTGIYCLPSCNARKPKPKNVVFYASPAEARAGSLRACKRCRPDDFQVGVDPQEQRVEHLLTTLDLPEIRNVLALAAHLRVGHSTLHALFREYLQTTPAEWLSRRRVTAACEQLVLTSAPAAQIAFAVGFESLSVFGEQFRRWTAMTPQTFRLLPTGTGFCLHLPKGYPIQSMLEQMGRDRQETTVRVEGQTCTVALRLPTGDALLRLTFQHCRVSAELQRTLPLTATEALTVHETLIRLLGLRTRPTRFEAQVLTSPTHSQLICERTGLRVSLNADRFDGLVWGILGQQVSFKAACLFHRRLLERAGTPLAEGLYAPPDPHTLWALGATELQAATGLTAARAILLHRVSGLVVSGHLDLRQLELGTATRAEHTLTAVPGVGPWTARYVLLRVFGFQDVVPSGDSALQSEAQRFFSLPVRPNAPQTEALFAQFSPYRSLAALHFWQQFAARAATKPSSRHKPSGRTHASATT